MENQTLESQLKAIVQKFKEEKTFSRDYLLKSTQKLLKDFKKLLC